MNTRHPTTRDGERRFTRRELEAVIRRAAELSAADAEAEEHLSEDELLALAGDGVFVDSLGGLHAGANRVSGDFSLQSQGFMIENGKKTRAVRSFTVAGNFYDLLKRIRAVASNIEIELGGGSSSFASPAVLVDGLSVAGK